MTGRPAAEGTAGRECVVLVNTLGRHSLWPAELETPAGWPVAHGPADRAQCLDFIDRASDHRHEAAEAAAA
jgi:MbtH protein